MKIKYVESGFLEDNTNNFDEEQTVIEVVTKADHEAFKKRVINRILDITYVLADKSLGRRDLLILIKKLENGK